MFIKYFWNFVFITFIFLLDRLSKVAIIKLAGQNQQTDIFITSFLNLNLMWNDGIAFGLLSFDKAKYYNLTTVIIILVTLIIAWMIIKTEKLEKLAFMMIFGGALGNIFDRLYYASVPDFIDLHVNNFHWFIFNVADIFISLGVFTLIFLEIFPKKKV
ncbi:signal peptidase II [Candidatus Pelagibacter sp.]|jgi:signal peptidase II|nr:signal peptidase II [Candidatus Pelagibacter sp.]